MTAKSLYAGMAGLVLLAGCASGAPARPSDFARRVATLVEGSDVPGLAVAVVHHGELVYAHGFGWRDPARTAPMTVDTVQMWFSCSKIVTATAAVRLAQQGRLDLDRPLVSYLADHGLRGPGVERLTARHLLSHTSGLPNPIPLRWMRLDSEIAEPRTDFYRRLIAEHGELRSLPGETMAYSNLNYLVLARVIEVTSGQSFEDYVQDQVLMPLGMRRTGFGPADRWGEDVAVPAMKEWRPYTWAVEWMVDGKILSGSAHGYRILHPFTVSEPAWGGLKGSVRDAAGLLNMQLGHDGGRVLLPAWRREMQRPVTIRDGAPAKSALGWHRRSDNLGTYLKHTGAAAGATAELRIYPDLDLGIAVFANASGTWTPVAPATSTVADLAAQTWGRPVSVASLSPQVGTSH